MAQKFCTKVMLFHHHFPGSNRYELQQGKTVIDFLNWHPACRKSNFYVGRNDFFLKSLYKRSDGSSLDTVLTITEAGESYNLATPVRLRRVQVGGALYILHWLFLLLATLNSLCLISCCAVEMGRAKGRVEAWASATPAVMSMATMLVEFTIAKFEYTWSNICLARPVAKEVATSACRYAITLTQHYTCKQFTCLFF